MRRTMLIVAAALATGCVTGASRATTSKQNPERVSRTKQYVVTASWLSRIPRFARTSTNSVSTVIVYRRADFDASGRPGAAAALKKTKVGRPD